MVQTVIIMVITGVIASIIGALIAIKVQQNYIQGLHKQNQAWERAQESHQHSWQQQQEKSIAEVETRLAIRVQQVQEEWQKWEAKDAERLEALEKQHEETEAQWRIKREIARLPRIEDTPLLNDPAHPHQHSLADWQSPRLQEANLSEQDLSHRYIGYADLRNARLVNTNFFMSDLSGASLTGADLTGADLSGANLSGADLRGAILTDANLHVADLQDAILIGANLLRARKLTTQQLYTALYDSSTQLDPSINITRPRLARVQPTQLSDVPEEKATNFVPTTPQPIPEKQRPAFLEALDTPHPTLLPDIEFFMPEEENTHFSLPLALSDSLLDLKVTDLLVDTPENRHIANSGTSTPK